MTLPINQTLPLYAVFADDNLLLNCSLSHLCGRAAELFVMGAESVISPCYVSKKRATPPRKLRNFKYLASFYNLSASQDSPYSTSTKQHPNKPFSLLRPIAFPATGLFFRPALPAGRIDTFANKWMQDST